MPHASSWSLYDHGFVRVAACAPHVRTADAKFNVQKTLNLAKRANDLGCLLAAFPEHGLSGRTNEALFHDGILDEVHDQLATLIDSSIHLTPVLIVGVPVRVAHQLLDCAVVVHRGNPLAAVPKTYPDTHRESRNRTQFSSAHEALARTVRLCGAEVPLGNDIVLEAQSIPGFALHVELGEDLRAPVSPSTYAALAGATILVNISVSSARPSDWRLLCQCQSARCAAVYLHSSASHGESATDSVTPALIYENGELLGEGSTIESQLTIADIDLDRLMHQRARSASFNEGVRAHAQALRQLRRVAFALDLPPVSVPLQRNIGRFPFVPHDANELEACCREAVSFQVQGLARCLKASGVHRVVLGLSGDLDSTHAALVAAQTYDSIGWPRSDIVGYAFHDMDADGERLEHAQQLMNALGISAGEIDTQPVEANLQLAERAAMLFRLANQHKAIVLGVSDLSALVFGDARAFGSDMSHYEVNAWVPRTLIAHLIRRVARHIDAPARTVLESILSARLSAELGPSRGSSAKNGQAPVGSYEVQDFNLYYLSVCRYRPSKVLFLTQHAWADKSRGFWPEMIPPDARREYDLDALHRLLEASIASLVRASELGRLPSHRRAPSDMPATSWLRELSQAYPEVYTDFTGS